MNLEKFLELNLRFVSFFGNGYIVPGLTLIIVAAYLYSKRYKVESALVLLTAISYPYSLFLKSLFKMPRPDPSVADFSLAGNYGFPSGHVVFYTVFWGYIIYLAFKISDLTSGLRNSIAIVASYFLLLVGVSRVYLNFHYVRDIAGGYVFGGVFLGFLIAVDLYLGKKLRESVSKD